MSFGDLLKNLLGPSPGRVEYAELSEDELLRLAGARQALTEEARAALDGELERRGLSRESAQPERPSAPPIAGDPVLVLERRGVVLRTQANASVLVMMPIWDGETPFAIERPEVKSNVTELVLLNQSSEGFLPAGYVAEKLTVRDQRIFALDPDGAVDRPLAGLSVDRIVVAEPFEQALELGNLTLERTEFPDVLIARWASNDLVVALGPRIPPAFFAAYGGITHVIGGLVAPQGEEERAIYADPDLYLSLETVILLLDCAGVTTWPVTLLPALGVTVQAVGREEGSESDELVIQMKQAVDAGSWDEAGGLLEELSAREIEDVIDGLTIERNLAAAERVIEMALASDDWKDSGRIHFLDGVRRFVAGDVDGAIAAHQRAVEGEEADPRAHANLSAIYRRRRDHAEAIRCAEAAVQAMPEDAISIGNLISALASAGRTSDARAAIDRYAGVLGAAGSLEWHARVDAWPPFEEGPDEFPHLADKAYQIGCIYASTGRIGEAIDLLSRCLELQPSHLEAVLELGVLLSSSQRDEEAIALYDTILAKAPGISFVRFNRANCLVRLERIPEAISELQRVADEVPEWDAPREAIKSLASARAGSES